MDIVSDKQTFRVPTPIKIGDKEVVKARAFTRLQTTLDNDADRLSPMSVPTFNPLKLTNRADVADTAPDPGPVRDDAEVAFRVQDSAPGRRRTGRRRIVAGRSASSGGRDAQSAARRGQGAVARRLRPNSC